MVPEDLETISEVLPKFDCEDAIDRDVGTVEVASSILLSSGCVAVVVKAGESSAATGII